MVTNLIANRTAEAFQRDDKMTDQANSNGEQFEVATRADEIEKIKESLRGLKFGSVNVIVQDGVVIQIDRTEKTRIRRTKSSS